MHYDIYQGNLLDWAAAYTGEPFHALLCDPPYHLTELNKRFGNERSAPAQYGTDGLFQRASRGFMGKQWDGGDIAFRPETWAALGQHLYPGAFGIAFASTRGYHRMVCAIEDAGMIIHPMLGWAFGSGFPKATRIDTQIDRAAGVERNVIGERKHAPKFNAKAQGYREKDNGFNSRDRQTFDITAPATDLAATWEGYRYGGQALKPAFEPICVFQKPYHGKPVDCITRTGAGALNIDGGRVERAAGDRVEYGVDGDERGWANDVYKALGPAPYNPHDAGRWPANLILSHNPACNGVCVEACAVCRLGEQSGESVSKAAERGAVNLGTFAGIVEAGSGKNRERLDNGQTRGHDDEGTAARYFYNADWMLDRLDAADPVRYVAKASTAEREAGLEGRGRTTVDDGRTTPIDNPYLRGETVRRNTHPTVKPIDLCRYLATLLLPPIPYAPRRLLVPFSGSGSEMIGAGLAGWEACQGIELGADHVEIAQARLLWWIDVFGGSQ